MKVTAEGDRCIAVELTDADMKELDITYDELDYSNIETRRVLWTLLDEARRVSGKNINLADRLMIETIPAQEGGCIILFTSMPADGRRGRDKIKMQNAAGPMICDFADVDAFLDFYEKATDEALRSEMNFFEKDGAYRAVLQPTPINREKMKAFAEEFGRCRCDRAAVLAAETREHWRRLGDG